MSVFSRRAEHAAKYSTNLARLLGASESDLESPEKRIQFLRNADPHEITNRTYAVAHGQVRYIIAAISI